MARKNPVLRRAELLDVAVTLIESTGLAALRVGDVARAAGVSVGLVMYHFQTKENLVLEAVIHAVERDLSLLDGIVRRYQNPTARLLAILDWYAPTGAARGWRVWIDAWSHAIHDPALTRALRDLQRRWNDAVATAISDGVAAGDFTCEDPQGAATRVTALLDGLAVRTILGHQVTGGQLHAWIAGQLAAELDLPADRMLAAQTASDR